MTDERLLPGDPILFVQDCIRRGRVFWTYHVNIRLESRFIPRESVLGAVETLELVEAYPDDKYLPSYLVLGRVGAAALHVLVAVDVRGDNIRIVTAYRPDPGDWHDDLKSRRSNQ